MIKVTIEIEGAEQAIQLRATQLLGLLADPSPPYLPPDDVESAFWPGPYPGLRQPQTPETGLGAIFGQWPGDETEEQIAEALEHLS